MFAIPTDKVSGFKTAIAAGKKLRDLVFKLSLANANAIASSDSRYKKRAHLVLREPQEYTPSWQGGDLGEDFGAEARLFDDLFCICSICGREKQAEILGLCINFSLHPWVNSKNRVDVQGVERYTYIEK